MHVHILNKVWQQKWDDWDTNTLPYRGTQVSIKLCIGSGPDISSQVDINSCTDACTHSKQGGLCPIHPGCGPAPCLEGVHASVHEFMSTWLLMSGPPPLHSLMETWVPLYGSVFVSQSSHFCCHTLFRMCTCISTWIYVYLTPHVWSTPYG